MLENIVESKYSNAVNSYTALDMTSKKIRGSLIEKKDKQIVIDIGNNKAMQIELIKDIDIKKGDVALIDRNNIAKSKVVDIEIYEKVKDDEKDIYSKKLKELGIEVNEENIKVLKKLDKAGLAITKDNFETYKLAKTSLNNISSSLDYESAIRLVEMDIDLENESIEKIALLVSEIEEEKEGLKIAHMFKRGELTTEDAEDIAKDIYGSKMGKDIIDIIKSLHKNEVSISKKNIEKINDVFYKLHNLEDLEDETFVDTIKNKLDINIDNLYKIKRYVKTEENNIEVDFKDIEQILKIENYDNDKIMQSKMTSKDIDNLEEDIKSLMVDLDLETSKDNVNLSKEFIKRSMDITKESIENVSEMKKALSLINKDLDKEMAAELMKTNINIDTADLREIAKEIEIIKGRENSLEKIDESLNSTEEIMSKMNSLKSIEEKDLLTLVERDIDFKIEKIEQVIFGKRQVGILDNAENTVKLVDEISKISTVFKEIGKLDFNTIAFQMKRNIPMTLMNFKESQEQVNIESVDTDLVEALKNNDLEASRLNVKKSMEAYTSFNNVKENLTSSMIREAVRNDIEIENMEIDLASKYVEEYRKSKGYSLVDNTSQILKNSDENIMFLMKQGRPLSFKELDETNKMFKNQDQLGHKIADVSEFVDEFGDDEAKERFERFKEDILGISRGMKGSKEDIEEAYKRMEKALKDIEEELNLSNKDQTDLIKEKTKEVSRNIDENKVLAKENKIIQFPLYMNGQFTNLNMYFRDRQEESSQRESGDISVVLSIDTVNMGNININLDIKKKNVIIKIALDSIEDKSFIEDHKNMLVDFLEKDGYEIDEITFHNEDEIDILNLEETSKMKPSISNGSLDLIV